MSALIDMDAYMEKTMHITLNDYQKIIELRELPVLAKKDPVIADRLMKELRVAKRFPQDKISKNIVTMNSRVLLKELKSARQTEISIVYPQDADIRLKKVSLFSPIGVALLGCREGDIASWRVPAGIGRFKVEKVLYQPEAEGHFSL